MRKMGCYHFHLNQLSRGKGQSAIASAAYRAGTKLKCTYYGEVSDYTRKGGVVLAEIHLPKQAPERFKDRETLWNEVEWIEGNKKAQLAHSFDIALMNEFSMEENIELARRFAMAIAAYCTNGKELPNALPIEPFNVLYQTAEDGIADTIKPRLAKCGADMTRVRFINEEEKQLSMTDDRIEKAIRQNNVRLMIMDPIQAYLGANVDMNRANEIRPLFRHLSTIAERTGCAIVLIGHLNKSSGSQSDYRSLGSIDIAAAVRSILFVEKVEKEKEQDIRVVYQQKDSLAKKENPVAFSLGEEGLKWLGEYDISIEDLLMGKAGTKKETKLEKAQKLILELLTKRKVMCLEELEAELLAYGISSRTGRDARKQLENRLSYDWCQGRKTVALTTE